MNRKELIKTAEDLVTDSKGILAADESTGTIKKRFEKINLESTPENRRRYRELLFTTPEIEKYIGGVIMFDETFRQSGSNGELFPVYLAERGIMPGIKVDSGKVDMPLFKGEMVTEGLDGLRDRLKEYRDKGARFSKWRAVYKIGEQMPTPALLGAHAEDLTRYAAYAQEAGIVPIVEPEILMEGTHDMERCADVTVRAMERMFERLFDYKVILEALIVKVNMVLPGVESGEKVDTKAIAEKTVEVMKKGVSVAVPSIVFLSGGQSPSQATEHLDAINEVVKATEGKAPWELNFSFGRALQEPVLAAWMGEDENVEAAQKEFLKRARFNSLALRGDYDKSMEEEK